MYIKQTSFVKTCSLFYINLLVLTFEQVVYKFLYLAEISFYS